MFLKRLQFSILFLSVFFALSGFIDSASSVNQKANKEFQNKKYQTALELYRKAQIERPAQPEILYNVGTTLYQVDQFQEAEQQLKKALDQNVKDKSLLSKNWYNYGNALYRLGKFNEAIEAYKKTLELNSKDKDAKHNLEILLKKKGMFEKKQQERSKQSPKQSQKKDQSQSNSSQQNQNKEDQKKDQETPSSGKAEEQKKEPDPKDEKDSESSPKPEEKKDPEKQEKNQNQNQQNEKPDQESNEESQSGEQPQPEKNEQYFQGQMSKEDAYRILNALKESEKELQVLRKPQGNKKPPEDSPVNDW